MSVKQHLVTAEELWEMPEVPGKRYELVDGELVEMPGAGAEHVWIAFALAQLLNDFARQHHLGFAVPDGLAYVLRRNPDHVRIPDVSFVAGVDVTKEGLPKTYWEGSPTLAVEIVSPNDRAMEIDERVRDYLDSGSHQVWVLWPNRRAVSVHRPGADIRELGPEAILKGGNILPGFSVRVSELFEIR